MSSHGGHPVCYPFASMGWHLSLHQMLAILLAILSTKMSMPTTHCLESFTHLQWMLTLMSMEEASGSTFIHHPREVFLAWCCVITRLLSSYGIVLDVTPSGSRLDWGGAGTSILSLADTHTLGNASFRHNEGGVSCDVGCVNVCVGLSLHMRDICHDLMYYLMKLVLPFCPLIFLFLWKVPALTMMRSSGFKPHGTYFLVIVLLLSLSLCHRLGLGLLKNGPQMVLYQWLHIHYHAWVEVPHLGPCALLKVGNKSQLEALAGTQTSNSLCFIPSLWTG